MTNEYVRKQDAVNAINEALKRVFTEHVGEGIINPLEPADVAPVVHARWILRKTDCNRYRECSACNVWLLWNMPRNSYCPNCGAKMDGHREE